MPEPGDSPDRSDADELFDSALVEVMEARESSGVAGMERVLSTYPEFSDALRKRVQKLERLGLIGKSGEGLEELLPKDFGPYQRMERLGGGGMGVVFRARHRELGREVALKLIRPELASTEKARARFHREMESMAKLSHPKILPLLESGEERGLPWFAMPLVSGCTVMELIQEAPDAAATSLRAVAMREIAARKVRERSLAQVKRSSSDTRESQDTWVEAALRIALDAAEALEYAHEQGILHRDIKPSNLFLPLRGPALLFDFGLAFGDDAESLTHTGGQLGSPAYMAPEQIRGEPASALTDVHGLGVTLYELLAFELPYLARNREDLQRRIMLGEALPLRKRVPSLSKDVETVCMVAMDKDPKRRYPSMGAFREDLQRLLDHEPIHARPQGALLRLRRWCQRHSSLATGLLLGGLLLFGIPSALYWQEHQDLERIEAERAKTTKQRDRARGFLDLALSSVDRFLVRVSGEESFSSPHLAQLGLSLSEDAVKLFEKVLEGEQEDSVLLRKDRAAALLNLARVRTVRGDAEQARRALDEAWGLARGQKGFADRDFLLARIADMRAQLAERSGDDKGAIRESTAVLDLLEGAKFGEKDLDALELEASSRARLALAQMRVGSLAEALAQIRHAERLHSKIASVRKGDAEHGLSWTLDMLREVEILLLLQQYRQAEPLLLKIRQRLESASYQVPKHPLRLFLVAQSKVMSAACNRVREKHELARNELTEAVSILRSLHGDYRFVREYTLRLGAALTRLADAELLRKHASAASKLRSEAKRVLEGMGEPGSNEELALQRLRLSRASARAARQIGDSKKAIRTLTQAEGLHRGIAEDDQSPTALVFEASQVQLDLASLLYRTDAARCRKLLEASLARKELLERRVPFRFDYSLELANCLDMLASILEQAGESDHAYARRKRVLELRHMLWQVQPEDPATAIAEARALHAVAMHTLQREGPEPARTLLLDAEKKLATAESKVVSSQSSVMASVRIRADLGRVCVKLGDLGRAQDVMLRLIHSAPKSPKTLFVAGELASRIACRSAARRPPKTITAELEVPKESLDLFIDAYAKSGLRGNSALSMLTRSPWLRIWTRYPPYRKLLESLAKQPYLRVPRMPPSKDFDPRKGK